MSGIWKSLRLRLGLVALGLLAVCLAYAYWFSSQPFIGYETYAASIHGALGVSAGYTLYFFAKAAILPLVIVALACIVSITHSHIGKGGKKPEDGD